MTNKEKQLLLKDICARLSYGGVKGLHRGQVHELFTIDGREANNACIQVDGYDAWFSVDTFKPYLRPMSSMTEEEIKTYHSYCECNDGDFTGEILYFDTIESFDYLNSIHIDYRGLIPMGLALEAPDGMYKTE